jgi:hypothetical protein
VRRKIRYAPDDIELDLSEPDLGHENGLDILQHHYRQSDRPGMGFSKASPAFVCLTHQGGTNPGLFLKKRGGEWWAVHYEAGECTSHRLPAPMSDEHKRQTEYWARAAQDAGWRVELEHALSTGTRPDALIHGPVMTGIEVQRSAMTASRAVARTGKAASAGVSDLWYCGRPGPRDGLGACRRCFPGNSVSMQAGTTSSGRRCRRGARLPPRGSAFSGP